jgi:hypothetical protein
VRGLRRGRGDGQAGGEEGLRLRLPLQLQIISPFIVAKPRTAQAAGVFLCRTGSATWSRSARPGLRQLPRSGCRHGPHQQRPGRPNLFYSAQFGKRLALHPPEFLYSNTGYGKITI